MTLAGHERTPSGTWTAARPWSLAGLLLSTVLTLACSRDMEEQVSYQSQESPRRHSPTGSVPQSSRGTLSAPPRKTERHLEAGARLFAINCAHCHGVTGEGDGAVAGYLREPPGNLRSAHVQGHSESDVYEVLTTGKDAMPGFRGELSAEERWLLVYYVRSLNGDARTAPTKAGHHTE